MSFKHRGKALAITFFSKKKKIKINNDCKL